MVTIRLSRGGAKKRPFYHLVATDSRNKRDGRYLERLGYFNPIAAGGEIRLNINTDRVDYWLGVGAQTSDRVAKLLKDYSKTGQQAAKTPVKKAEIKAAPKAAEPVVAKEAAPEAEPATAEATPEAPADTSSDTKD